MNAIRLALADDHAVLRAGLRAFFEEQQNPVLQIVGEAASGEDAIKLVEAQRPDLLILDLSMPGMGGLETTQELRQKGNRVRILILTQFGEAIYLRRVLEAGANGYILKSARGDELLAAIRAIAGGGTYIDPNMAGALVSSAIGGATQGEAPATAAGAEEAYSKLTPREKQILKFIAEGAANKEIANSLDLSVKTVMTHRVNLMEKLGIKNRSKLIQFAIQVGLIQLPKE